MGEINKTVTLIMTVRGHTFEHDYPPTPFNEPIRPLPEAALNAEPSDRTSNLGLVSFQEFHCFFFSKMTQK